MCERNVPFFSFLLNYPVNDSLNGIFSFLISPTHYTKLKSISSPFKQLIKSVSSYSVYLELVFCVKVISRPMRKQKNNRDQWPKRAEQRDIERVREWARFCIHILLGTGERIFLIPFIFVRMKTCVFLPPDKRKFTVDGVSPVGGIFSPSHVLYPFNGCIDSVR